MYTANSMNDSTAYLPPSTAAEETVAWVVFSDQAPVWWARFLKHGFRHCFMIQRDGHCWRILDPYTQPPKTMRLPFPSNFDLPEWLCGQGLTLIQTTALEIPAIGSANRFRRMTKALGLTRMIWTPWQLYRQLCTPLYI